MSEDKAGDSIHTGRCLCGAVRFTTRGPLRGVIACHCSQCRRQTGHYYAATSVADDRLTIEGVGNLSWFRATPKAARGFCRTCGSALFWKYDGETATSIGAGAFDEPTGLRLTTHIYCADKGDYYDIADDLPHYPLGSPGLVVAGG